jgi:adenylylsulfate kinase
VSNRTVRIREINISYEIERQLYNLNCRSYVLDGDNIRHGLYKDLGFGPDDGKENIRRIAEVAKLFVDAGIVAVTLYKKARAGEILQFTGISAPYEPPVLPEITIESDRQTVIESAAQVLDFLTLYIRSDPGMFTHSRL